ADEVTERLAAPALREEPRGVDRVPRHVWHAENVGPVVPAQAPEGAAELEIAEVKHRGGLTVFPVVREKPARHEPLGQDMMIDDGLVGVYHLPAGALDSATEVGVVVLEQPPASGANQERESPSACAVETRYERFAPHGYSSPG